MNYYTNATKYYLIEILISIAFFFKGKNPLQGWKSYKQWCKEQTTSTGSLYL